MALPFTWHLRPRSHKCEITEATFEEGDFFYTALFPDEETSGYLRKDYSEEAWDKHQKELPKPFSYWRSKYKAPIREEKPEISPGDDPIELLSKLVEEDAEYTENTRYILALMLERSKVLKETDTQKTPHNLLRIYEHRKTGEIFIIRDPLIPLTKVEELQKEVQTLLEGSLGKPTPPAENLERTPAQENGEREQQSHIGQSP